MRSVCDFETKRFKNGILDEPQEKRARGGNTRQAVDFDLGQNKLLSDRCHILRDALSNSELRI